MSFLLLYIAKKKNFDVYINEQQINLRVEQMALEIFQSLNGKVPHFIAVLNGSFIFASDLLRAYPGDCKVSFVKLSSYTGMESTGKVSELIGLNEVLDDEVLVVLEDIVDTGTTLLKIDEILKAKGKSWQISSLFLKPDAYKGDRKIDFIGFDIIIIETVGVGQIELDVIESVSYTHLRAHETPEHSRLPHVR